MTKHLAAALILAAGTAGLANAETVDLTRGRPAAAAVQDTRTGTVYVLPEPRRLQGAKITQTGPHSYTIELPKKGAAKK